MLGSKRFKHEASHRCKVGLGTIASYGKRERLTQIPGSCRYLACAGLPFGQIKLAANIDWKVSPFAGPSFPPVGIVIKAPFGPPQLQLGGRVLTGHSYCTWGSKCLALFPKFTMQLAHRAVHIRSADGCSKPNKSPPSCLQRSISIFSLTQASSRLLCSWPMRHEVSRACIAPYQIWGSESATRPLHYATLH